MIRNLYPYIKPYKKALLYSLLLVGIDVICEMMIPLLMARIVDSGIPSQDIGYIAGTGLFMVLLAGIAISFGVLNMKLSAEVSQGFAANLRQSLFDKVQSFSFTNIDRFSSASLITRLTSDVTQLQNALMMALRMLLRAPLMLLSAIFFSMSINLKLSMVIFVAVPLLTFGVLLIIRSAEQRFARTQHKLDNLNGTIQENLTAIRVVKAFVREAYEKLKFKHSNDELTQAAVHAGNLISLIMPLMLLILNGATVATIWFGGNMVGTGEMGTGALISFISYLLQIMMSVMIFSLIFILLARAEASGKRILEVLNTEAECSPCKQKSTANAAIARGKIEFRHVDFSYAPDSNEKNVLTDISFSVEPGQFVAIVGGTGSGKTSLVSLIPRLYDATGGQVLIDGKDVHSYTLNSLRASIGMVLQKNMLFSGTIRDNLLWGNEQATQYEIEQAARNAQAHDFIMNFPHGYDTELGQGGVNVSGGQKQRLCIARAMLKQPAILLLDDSTSALDTATEAKVRQALQRNFNNTTVLLVAQRISSVKEADKIIVLDDGKISGIGTHTELLKNNTVYREICTSQQEGLVS
ncbi:hypothetical protein P22_0760 [Propionispora sp. 2/2-37]|uniref:ABC transporter ATP-binding protein n=1 Tax=Propionispora sp. 2/2-37 TaxID=1677858 RepID=UPI0006BB8A5A|nr:ABC transporter ATP-binding protein [Propionispora sp. 2/2-37]CUH94694.1 hypothetical protein P22_0760 [Propionispora sp. 2/2-37]